MRDQIRYWLESYIDRSELDGVTDYMMYLLNKRLKAVFVSGMILGFILAILVLRWVA